MVNEIMSFSEIAHIYDHFNDLEIYERWLDFTLNASDVQPRYVLDAACGTGWFTQLLAPFCEQIVGFDIDVQMIEVAKREQGEADNMVYQVADILDLQALPQTFDLVTCYADSLCFLANQAEVARALQELSQRLVPEGVLLFDVWTPAQIQQFDGFQYFDSDERYALLWDSESDQETLSVQHYLTVFEQTDTPNGLFKRRDVVLSEKTYPLAWYYEALQQAGFEQIEVFVDYGEAYYDAVQHVQAERWFFRCVKAK